MTRIMNKHQFIKAVNEACMAVDPDPEHGKHAYKDVIELLIAQYVIAPGDSIDDCRDAVLGHMSGPPKVGG